MLIWGWPICLLLWLFDEITRPIEATPLSTFRDLKTTLDANLATQTTDADALAKATADKAHADTDVTSSTVAFSAAVKAAPGSFVVDATGPTVTLYTSPDGLTFSSVVIASITDPAPGSGPTPTA